MKLSRTVEYALQATLHLAQSNSGAPVPSSQLAAAGSMPERFLLQVLRSLVNRGILNSTRGVVGGYALGRSANEISLLDLIEAIEGPLVAGLPETQSLPPAAVATLRQTLDRAVNALRTELQALKLSDLLPKPGDGEAAAL
jgi:Rrf2 family protein